MVIGKTRKLIVSFLTVILLSFVTPLAAAAEDPANIKVAKELYAAFNEGNMQKLLSLFSADVVFVFHGPQDILPQAGTFKGHEGVVQFFAAVSQNLEIKAIGQRLFSLEGDVVSVLGWEAGVSVATGGEYKANWVHVITVENGVITHFEEITDSGAIAEALAPADVDRGKAYYTTCLGCHGLNGEGQWAMHAPRLTLQDSEYLIRQLRHYRQSIRGGVQDFYGWQMNGRATALPGDRAIRDVVAYIDTLPDVVASDKVDGNTRKGRSIYQSSCTSCHGDKGQGNADYKAPRLAGLDGWYQLEQLTKYKNGLRGFSAGDLTGNQMRAAVSVLNNEQEMKDVTAYIMSLAR